MSCRLQRGCSHVVGAGLAGLAAAVELAAAGRRVRLYEAAAQAGGRCRSYFDAELACRIDNGNHLLLSGNRVALEYLGRLGALDTLHGPLRAAFAFVDAASGRRWCLRPNRGRLPWWILQRSRRVPDTGIADYLAALRLRRAGATATVAEMLAGSRRLFRDLWEPLAVAALNTAANRGSARLFWRVLADTLGRGGVACRPLVPRQGLSETFVAPALAMLSGAGAELRFGARLRALEFSPDRVTALVFDSGPVAVGEADDLVLAVPATIAARLVPTLTVPAESSPIVNGHFRCEAPAGSPLLVGIIGGTAQWVFCKPHILSVTVSAADRIVDQPVDALRETLWRDVALAYRLPAAPVPPARIVKERRATFLATPEQLRLRPMSKTRWRNLALAGDYTDTGLPATIEGAIGSGLTAGRLVLQGSGPLSRRQRAISSLAS